MSATHNDVKLLIEFSIEYNLEAALASFPMFAPEQIQKLFDISISQRVDLLHNWEVDNEETAHFLRHFHDCHNPAQAEKMRQQSTDPSNR